MDISVESGGDDDYHIKFQGVDWEFNVRLLVNEVGELNRLRSAQWGTESVIRVGQSAGADVFWAYNTDSDSVSILVGHDDVTWDFGVMVPPPDLREAINEYVRIL